jgi:hypothetical protein
MRRFPGPQALLHRKYLDELEAKYPSPALSYPKEDVAKISVCHFLEIDHLYRDQWGGRTALTGFQDGVIEIAAYSHNIVFTGSPHRKRRLLDQIEAWFCNRFLRRATAFTAHIYTSQYEGCETRCEEERALGAHNFLRFGPLEPTAPDTKAFEWHGTIGKAAELAETPEDEWPEGVY